MAKNPDAPWQDAPEAASWEAAPITKSGYRPGKTESFFRGGAQGVTFGFGDEVNGAIQALAEKLSGSDKAMGDLYRLNRDSFRREDQAAEDAHRGWYLGGNVAGGILTTPLLPGGGAMKGAKLLQLIKHGAKVGAGMGALAGAGASNADLTRGEVGRFAGDTVASTALGGVLGGATPVLGAGLGWVGRRAGSGARALRDLVATPMVVPSEAARKLEAEGVALTLGQKDPGSWIARVEDSAAEAGGGGLKTMRTEAEDQARRALVLKGRAQGSTNMAAGPSVDDAMQAVRQSYGEGYSQALDGHRLDPDLYLGNGKWRGMLTDESVVGSAKRKGAFELATSNPNIDATDDARSAALKWLKQQYTSLPKGANETGVDASELQLLRRRLRTEARRLGSMPAEDAQAKAQMYKDAAGHITEVMESQLPEESSKALRSLDARYSTKKALENLVDSPVAVAADGKFTPIAALKEFHAQGAAPEMTEMAAAMRDSFSKAPMTGARGPVYESAFGLVPKPLRAPMLRFANTNETARSFALGETGLQQALRSGRAPALLQAMSRYGGAPVRALSAVPNKNAALIRALLSRANEPALAEADPTAPPAVAGW